MSFPSLNPSEVYRQVAPLWREAGARPLDLVEALLTMLAIAKHQQSDDEQIYDLQHGELIQPTWEELHDRLAAALELPVERNIDEIAARTPGLLEQTRRALSPAFVVVSDDFRKDFSHELLNFFLHAVQAGFRDSPAYFKWPRYLAPLLLGLLGPPSEEDAIYCPFDSSGLLAAVLADYGWSVDCELSNHQAARILRLLAFIGDWRLKVRIGDPVREPQWVNGEGLTHFKSSAAITTFGSRYKEDLWADRYARFPIRSYYGETIQIAHMVAQTGGRLVCIVPESFLFRTAGGEREYKQWLVRRGILSCVIRLPRDVFAPTANVQSSIIIIDTLHPVGDMLFVDARRYFSRNERRSLDPGHAVDGAVEEILSIVHGRQSSQNSALASYEDIANQDFNISVDRYVVDPTLRRQQQLLAEQQTIPLGDLVELYRPQARSQVMPADSDEDHITLYETATGDVHDGIVERPARVTEVPSHHLHNVGRAILKRDDILISIKGKVGVVGLVPDEASSEKSRVWTAGQTFVIARLRRSTALMSPTVLAAYLASPFGQVQLQALAGGVTVPLIQISDLKRLLVPLPPREKQKRIIHEFQNIHELRKKIQSIENEIQEGARNLSKLFVSQND
jgi:type I restriction enzyme M protein